MATTYLKLNRELLFKRVMETGKSLAEVTEALDIPRATFARLVNKGGTVRYVTAHKLIKFFGDDIVTHAAVGG